MVFCGPHEGRHTGVLVAKKLDEVIDSLLLPENCHKAMTTDNAANMKVACRESRTIDLGTTCFAHTLNLVVVNAIKSVPKIQIAVDEFKKLVGGCHKSTLYCERIRKECEDLNRSGNCSTNHVIIRNTQYLTRVLSIIHEMALVFQISPGQLLFIVVLPTIAFNNYN